MRQVWAGSLGVLSAVAIGCVAVAAPEVARAGSLRGLFGGDGVVHAATSPRAPPPPEPEPPAAVARGEADRDLSNSVGPPLTAQAVMQGQGALDVVIPEWMVRQGERVKVRFPGGRTLQVPFFTRVQPGVYMLELSGPSFKPVLCQVEVRSGRRTHVTFGGQSCQVEQND